MLFAVDFILLLLLLLLLKLLAFVLSKALELNFCTRKMAILNALGIFVVRAANAYNYSAEWSRIPGSDYVKKLTDEDDHFIQNQQAMLLFFYNRSCPHCTRVKPHFASASEELANKGSKVQMAAIEFNHFPNVGKRYGIRKVPGIYHFKNGRVEKMYTGTETASEFVAYALKLKV